MSGKKVSENLVGSVGWRHAEQKREHLSTPEAPWGESNNGEESGIVTYDRSRSYEEDAIVLRGLTLYVANSDIPAGTPFVAGDKDLMWSPTKGVATTLIPTWSVVNTYIKDEPVIYNGKLYVARRKVVGSTPWSTDNFKQITEDCEARITPPAFIASNEYKEGELVRNGVDWYIALKTHDVDVAWNKNDWLKITNVPTTIKGFEVDKVYTDGEVISLPSGIYASIGTQSSKTLVLDNWTLLARKDCLAPDWVPNTVYPRHQLVVRNGDLYRAKQLLTNHTWSIFDWDKLTNNSSLDKAIVTEWSAEAELVKNELIVHDGTMYRVNESFTAGTEFSESKLTPTSVTVEATPMTIKPFSSTAVYIQDQPVTRNGELYTAKGKFGPQAWDVNSFQKVGGNAEAVKPVAPSSVFGIDYIPPQAGEGVVMFVGTDGNIYMSGAAATLVMGTGSDDHVFGFSQVPLDTRSGILKCTVIAKTCFALMNDGRMYTWGRNSEGQCGINGGRNIPTPMLIGDDIVDFNATVDVQLNSIHSMTYIKRTDNQWYGSGNNSNGRLGNGDTAVIKSFTKLGDMPDGSGIRKLWSFGGSYGITYVETTSDAIYCTGTNGGGNFGNGSVANSALWVKMDVTPEFVRNIAEVRCEAGGYAGSATSSAATYFLTKDGKVHMCGRNGSGCSGLEIAEGVAVTTVTEIPLEYPVTEINVLGGGGYIGVLCNHGGHGKLSAWGYNVTNMLGLDHSNSPVSHPEVTDVVMTKLVRTYGSHAYSYKMNSVYLNGDEIRICGDNSVGTHGIGNVIARNGWSKPLLFEEGVKQVYSYQNGSGDNAIFAVLNDGRMYGWGYGGYRTLIGLFNTLHKNRTYVPNRLC